MIEIEKYPCNDFKEASKRERYWFEKLDADLNKQIPSRTQKEYLYSHKEKIKANKTKYYLENKSYFEKKHKAYYEQNKAEINAYNRQLIKCDCGKEYTLGNIRRHEKCKKHQKYLHQEKLKNGIIKCVTLSEFMNFMKH